MAINQNLMRFQVNRGLMASGAVVAGIGAVMSLAGTVIVFSALASAGRQWVQQLETPPGELATRALHQAKAASMAGLEAWRAESAASPN